MVYPADGGDKESAETRTFMNAAGREGFTALGSEVVFQISTAPGIQHWNRGFRRRCPPHHTMTIDHLEVVRDE